MLDNVIILIFLFISPISIETQIVSILCFFLLEELSNFKPKTLNWPFLDLPCISWTWKIGQFPNFLSTNSHDLQPVSILFYCWFSSAHCCVLCWSYLYHLAFLCDGQNLWQIWILIWRLGISIGLQIVRSPLRPPIVGLSKIRTQYWAFLTLLGICWQKSWTNSDLALAMTSWTSGRK